MVDSMCDFEEEDTHCIEYCPRWADAFSENTSINDLNRSNCWCLCFIYREVVSVIRNSIRIVKGILQFPEVLIQTHNGAYYGRLLVPLNKCPGRNFSEYIETRFEEIFLDFIAPILHQVEIEHFSYYFVINPLNYWTRISNRRDTPKNRRMWLMSDFKDLNVLNPYLFYLLYVLKWRLVYCERFILFLNRFILLCDNFTYRENDYEIEHQDVRIVHASLPNGIDACSYFIFLKWIFFADADNVERENPYNYLMEECRHLKYVAYMNRIVHNCSNASIIVNKNFLNMRTIRRHYQTTLEVFSILFRRLYHPQNRITRSMFRINLRYATTLEDYYFKEQRKIVLQIASIQHNARYGIEGFMENNLDLLLQLPQELQYEYHGVIRREG